MKINKYKKINEIVDNFIITENVLGKNVGYHYSEQSEYIEFLFIKINIYVCRLKILKNCNKYIILDYENSKRLSFDSIINSMKYIEGVLKIDDF